MREPITITIDSTAIGKRFVGKNHSTARQEYVKDEALAFRFFDDSVAKDFCKTWAAKTGMMFSAVQGGRVIYTVKGGKKQ